MTERHKFIIIIIIIIIIMLVPELNQFVPRRITQILSRTSLAHVHRTNLGGGAGDNPGKYNNPTVLS